MPESNKDEKYYMKKVKEYISELTTETQRKAVIAIHDLQEKEEKSWK